MADVGRPRDVSLTATVADETRHTRFIATLSAIAALDLCLFFWYLRASIVRRLYWDMYSWVLHYLDYRASGGWWAYLWAGHDVHRPVWIRLLTALDIEAFSGVSYPFIVSTTVFHLVIAGLLWRECRAGVRGSLGTVLGCVVLMLVLTSVASVNGAVPLTNGYLHVLDFSVLAIILFGSDPGAGNTNGRAVHWRRGAALLAALSAPLASAVGWAIWPILLWMAWRGGAGRGWMLAVAGLGAAFMAVYLPGLSTAVGAATVTPGGLDPVGDLLGRVNYLFTYLGLPWTRAAALAFPGRIFGALLFGAGARAVVWRGVLRPTQGRLERIAVALIMFSLASALLATLGRVDASARDGVLVPVRYSVLLMPLHVGLLWIASPVLNRLWNEERRWPTVAVGIMGACVLLLVQQVAAGQAAARTTRFMRATIERFEAGQTDQDMTSVIYVDLDQARRELDMIRRAGLYVDLK